MKFARVRYLRILTVWNVGLTLLAVSGAILGIFGAIAYNQGNAKVVIDSGFRRDFEPNCNDFFFCVNATDPNPSYIQFRTPPLLDTVNNYQFLRGASFDISEPDSVAILADGIYLFTGFFSFLSAEPEEIAVLITAGNETLLTAPVVDGTLSVSMPFEILGNTTVAVGRFATTARLSAGTVLRVGVVVSGDAFIAPGGHWAGVRLFQ